MAGTTVGEVIAWPAGSGTAPGSGASSRRGVDELWPDRVDAPAQVDVLARGRIGLGTGAMVAPREGTDLGRRDEIVLNFFRTSSCGKARGAVPVSVRQKAQKILVEALEAAACVRRGRGASTSRKETMR